MAGNEWWQETYGHTLWLGLDFMARDDAQMRSEAETIVRMAELQPGDSVLDIACGAGRHCRVFADLGFRVVGVDQSLAVLQVARDTLGTAPTDITFVHGDMRSLPVHTGSFSCATNLWTSWAVFETDQENLMALSEALRCLKVGGKLVLDYNNKWASNASARTGEPLDMGEYVHQRISSFDRDTGIYSGTEIYTWKHNGNVRRDPWQVRIYKPDELVEMLGQVGFSCVRLFDGWTGLPMHTESQRIVALATKT